MCNNNNWQTAILIVAQYTEMLAKELGYDDGGGSTESIENVHNDK